MERSTFYSYGEEEEDQREKRHQRVEWKHFTEDKVTKHFTEDKVIKHVKCTSLHGASSCRPTVTRSC